MTGCDLLLDVDRVRVSMAGRTVGALVMSPEHTLAFAYDLTENPGINGEHTTAVNGRGRGISVDDLVSVGVMAGIPRARCVSVAEEMRARIAGEGFAVRD